MPKDDDINLEVDDPPFAVKPTIKNNPDIRNPANIAVKTQFHHLRK
jgi:hypothetical protein